VRHWRQERRSARLAAADAMASWARPQGDAAVQEPGSRQLPCRRRRLAPARPAAAMALLAVLAACALAAAPALAAAGDAGDSYALRAGAGAAGGEREAAGGGSGPAASRAAPLRHGYRYLGRVEFVGAARGGVPVADLGAGAPAARGAGGGGGSGAPAPQHHTVLVTAEGHRFTKRCASPGLFYGKCNTQLYAAPLCTRDMGLCVVQVTHRPG